MATTVQKITLSSSRDIPFNKLVLSQSNVRRVKAGVSIEELSEDIARRGLLQGLNVRPVLDAEGAETGMFEVPAGGRRYRALERLVKQKRLAKTAPVPCIPKAADAATSAEEDSLAENVQRVALHPLDQFRAFLAMREKGQPDEDIAAAFFVPVNVVKQRLRLAAVAPSLLDLYAEDGITLEQLMAFTVTHDHARQAQVWEVVQRSYSKEAYQIRRMLTETTVRASDKRAQFVGLGAYAEAGGVIMRDLFQNDDGGWLEDVALLDRLVADKLKVEAEAIGTEGWKWISVAVETPYGHVNGLRELSGTTTDLSVEEQATIEALNTEYAKFEAEYEGADELPDEVDERLGEIETALAGFDDRPVIYDPNDIVRAGVFVSIDGEGKLSVDRGYVRPEDEAPVTVDGESDTGAECATPEASDPSTPMVQRAIITIGGQVEAEDDDDDVIKPLPERLVTELTTHRTLALRDALATNPHVALTALLHKLVLDTFQRTSSSGGCLEASVRHVSFSVQAADLKDSPSAKAIAARQDDWKTDLPADEDALWDWLVGLDDASRSALLAHCVSYGVNALYEKVDRYGGAGLSQHGLERRLKHADRLARAVGLDMVDAGWRPTVDNYLSRVTKPRILEAVREAKGEQSAQLIDHLKKGDMAREAERLNAQAKSAARSAFEGAKQRFFSHLITSMKTPSLIRSIERDLEEGHAAVIQIVSTGEALMERRLAEIPTEDWGDVQIDITPREYVLDYLAHSFPVQLYEPFTDSEGKLSSRPVYRDGQPVESREAVARRDRLIERLASLTPVPGALDQIVQRFGTDLVAEVTGRSRRIIRKTGAGGVDRLMVETRAGSANLAETQAFMDDAKRILVFSEAGGTGRSYHAELSAKNRRLRVHYLLEAGWKADAAIQGLGRTNRTNQQQPPLFRPIATNVKAEKRFLSTIARRLDTLGAITKGQRQTGGQGLFRPEDNLESHYARDALRQLYLLLVRGKVEGCSLQMFEDATGLSLMDSGGIKDELPPITTFLNRLLALTIDLQNILFTAFEQLLSSRIEGAIASGVYDVGLETLTAESFVVTDRQAIYTHPGTSAETRLLTITQRERNRPVTLDEALNHLTDPRAVLLINGQSGRAAVQVPTSSLMLDNGEVERRVRLIRPMEHPAMPLAMMPQTHWVEADRQVFDRAWEAELTEVPTFTDSTIHIVSGLLLPIWKRLPTESTRVYRLQTDTGERIVGRRVSPAWVAGATATGSSTLSPEDAFTALMDGKTILDLAEELQLRRVRVMGVKRIELSGFTDTMRDRLRTYGLFHEIISWKLRMFVPTDAAGPAILAKVLERYPLARIAEREAA